MLQLILGPAKSGKTTWIDRKIAEVADEGKTIFLIVPEQYTFETEKRLFHALSAEQLAHVTVTSFTRTAQTAFKLYGGGAGVYANESAKAVLMAQAVAEVQDRLSVYAKSAKSDAFVQTMLEAVNELKNAGVEPQELRDCALQIEEEHLREKALETAELYGVYDALLHTAYLDPLDDITRAGKILQQTDHFDGAAVFFDEFKGFTGNQTEIIRLILRRADAVCAALCIDPNRAEESLYRSVKREEQRFIRYARQEGVKVAAPVKLTETYFDAPVLGRMEKALFSPLKAESAEESDRLMLVQCRDSYEEAEYTAAMIRKLTREEGYAYKDIAVLSRLPEEYDAKLETAFARLNIPYFADRTKPASDHPLIRFVESVLACAAHGFASDRILSLVKSGMYALAPEDVGLFENYCFVWDIRGMQWRKPFTLHPRGFQEVFTDADTELLQKVEQVRSAVIEPLTRFCDTVRETSGIGFCRAVYDYLCESGAANEMERRIDAEYLQDDYAGAKDETAVWDAMMQLLDTLASAIGDKPLTCDRFLRLFRLAAQTLKRGTLPQTADCVTVAGADRFRFGKKRAVFVLGANEQVLPKIPAEGGIFSDRERRILIGLSLELNPPADEQLYEERFIAYRALTAATERLIITAPKFAENGGGRSLSSDVASAAQRAGAMLYDTTDLPLEVFCQNPQTAWLQLARRYWSDTKETAALRSVLAEREDTAAQLRAMERILSAQEFKLADLKNAGKLFGTSMNLSPTRVEDYYRCPFHYFMAHGLRLRPVKKAELDPIETGSLIHTILYEMLEQLDFGEGYDRAAAEEFIRLRLEAYIETVMGGSEDKSRRFLYLCRRMRQTILRIADHLHEQFIVGGFEPCALEYEIEEHADVTPLILTAADGTRIRVAGKIDRIDRYYSKDGKLYIRVVDYKSGRKQFNLDDVLNGLNLQMLIYLHCIVKNGRGDYSAALPAGILYMPASDPKPSLAQNAADGEIARQWQKSYQMNGLLLNDLEVLDAMDPGFSGAFIPIAAKKYGTFTSESVKSLANLRELGRIGKYLEKLVCDMAEELHQGRIEALPVDKICGYCEYRAVCGHNDASPVKMCARMSKDAVLEQMKGVEDDG